MKYALRFEFDSEILQDFRDLHGYNLVEDFLEHLGNYQLRTESLLDNDDVFSGLRFLSEEYNPSLDMTEDTFNLQFTKRN